MKNQCRMEMPLETVVARFGAATLVRTVDGRFELRGGGKSELIEAREWASLFLHEAVIRNH